MTRITFRMDDITPEMDWSRFQQFKKLFERYRNKPLLGIVPENRDPKLMVSGPNSDFWEEMRRLQEAGWSVAQHGYQHRYETQDGGLLGIKARSEFASLPYEIQYEKIQKGKERLREHGIESDIWMAPGHSYDRNTLRALCNSGFRIVSDGFSLFPYEYMELRFIPCQFGVPRKLPFGVVTICIHANAMTDLGFEAFARWVEQHRDAICDFSDLLVVPVYNLSRTFIEPFALLLRRMKQRVRP